MFPAIAGAALVGLGASAANASLTLDVVATGTSNPAGFVIGGGGKAVSVTGTAANGDTVSFDVFANISNGNGNSSDDGLVNAFASFSSSINGAFRGDLLAARDSNFTASGSSAGKQVDLDGDGDLDVGNPVQTSATNWFNARANTAPTPIFGNHIRIGTLTLTITQILSGSTSVNVLLRNQPSSSAPYNWEEDGAFLTANTAATNFGQVNQGAPVVFDTAGGGVTPEPASVGILALGGLTALARRRRS